jgi:AraC family transcriptional regulator
MTHPARAFWLPARPSGYHALHRGAGFAVQDCVCRLVRESPASTNVFKAHRVALLLGGTFHYETDFGPTLLGPGSMLLGRSGCGYCYRHVDDGGDRTVTFDFSNELLEEVRRSLGSRSTDRADFRVPSIPASRQTAAATALAFKALRLNDSELWEEVALLVATTAVGVSAQLRLPAEIPRPAKQSEHLTIARALRHIETNHHQDCSLRALADGTGMSIYRFLRLFRSLTSQTPRQYLLATRLRAALSRLIETPDRILEIAYDVGFGDISHFNQLFTTTFGVPPRQFRRQHGTGAMFPKRRSG